MVIMVLLQCYDVVVKKVASTDHKGKLKVSVCVKIFLEYYY